MALQNTDKFLVQRGSVQYEMTADQINAFINAGQDLTALSFSDFQSLTFVGGATAKIGDKVFINDASDDASVDAGFAVYRISGLTPLSFDKIQEGESLDLQIGGSNLAFTATPTGIVVDNDNGDGGSIPLADTVNAGLMSPSDKANVHAPITLGAAGATPLNLAGQQLGFDISQLDPLP